MTKQRGYLVAMLTASAMLSACGTAVHSLPLPASATAPDANGVKVYFGAQAHPAVKTELGRHSESVRVERGSGAPQPTCENALTQALGELRTYAKRHGANAVVNVTTRFHGTHSESTTEYTCGVSLSAGAIVVSGDVVTIDAP